MVKILYLRNLFERLTIASMTLLKLHLFFGLAGTFLLRKNDLYENLNIFGLSRSLLPLLQNYLTFYLQLLLLLFV